VRNSQNKQTVDRFIADFEERIAKMRREGVLSYELDRKTPWAVIPEAEKLEYIVSESQKMWLRAESYAGSAAVAQAVAVPGNAALEMVERNVTYAGLPVVQREMLEELRVNVDAGHFAEEHPDRKDLVAMALARIVGVGQLEQTLAWSKEREDAPWAEVPEVAKVRVLVAMAADMAPPGAYALAAIEREVEYGKLPSWRREALEDLRIVLDRGELDGENRDPGSQSDFALLALRMGEVEARIEEGKRVGMLDDQGQRLAWRELWEEVKFDLIHAEIDNLHLKSDARAYEILGREVDISRVSKEQRREFEDGRRLAWPRQAVEMDAFDRVAANPEQQWLDDGHGSLWRDLPADNQVGFLAAYAARHDVSFDRFTDAARRMFGMGPGQKFTADDEWHLRGQFHTAFQDYPGDRDSYPQPVSFRGRPLKGIYQVWHDRGWPARPTDQLLDPAQAPRFPDDYVRVANVHAVGITNHGQRPWYEEGPPRGPST
jgi:hypothetical protein